MEQPILIFQWLSTVDEQRFLSILRGCGHRTPLDARDDSVMEPFWVTEMRSFLATYFIVLRAWREGGMTGFVVIETLSNRAWNLTHSLF